MNASKFDAAAALIELEQIGGEIDRTLTLLTERDSGETRQPLLEELTFLLERRGTVLDALLAWCSSPEGKRATSSRRTQWQEAFARLRRSDQRRAALLKELVETTGAQLRKRTVQQAVFIYQRGQQ